MMIVWVLIYFGVEMRLLCVLRLLVVAALVVVCGMERIDDFTGKDWVVIVLLILAFERVDDLRVRVREGRAVKGGWG